MLPRRKGMEQQRTGESYVTGNFVGRIVHLLLLWSLNNGVHLAWIACVGKLRNMYTQHFSQ
jgi:hypothetical protein